MEQGKWGQTVPDERRPQAAAQRDPHESGIGIPPAGARLHHLALTVTDLDASVEWYGQVFGLRAFKEGPHEGGFARVLSTSDRSLMIALHRHDRNAGQRFSETDTGMDHVGLGVPSRADLVAWQAHLEAHGVVRAAAADRPLTQSPIADEPYASILVFRDPDNIQLELFAFAGAAVEQAISQAFAARDDLDA